MIIKAGKFRINGFSLIITCLFIAVIILLNIFVRMLTDRYFLRADLTDTGLYTLSDTAAQFLQDVSEPVDIVVLEEEAGWLASNAYSILVRVLENYSAETGGRINVQYVNPDLNTFNGPGYGNNLTTLKESHTELNDMQRGDIVFISSRRAARVNSFDLFTREYNPNTGRTVTSGINADQELISSLQYVLNESIARAVFTVNHQENSNEYLRLILERTGYVCQDINLAIEDIPGDTLLLISTGPKLDFLDSELLRLEQYLNFGGSAMILYDFSVTSLPLLDTFMEQWGIIVDNKMIFDEDNTYIPQIGVIGAHVVAGGLRSTHEAESVTKSEIPMGIYLPRPLRAAWVGEASGGFILQPLIQTFSASSYAKELVEGNAVTWERESGDDSGPFVLAYNSRKMTTNPEGRQVYANFITAGADMFSDVFMSNYGNTFYNVLFIADIAGDLNPFSEGIYIPSKALFDSSMPVSSGGARGVLIIMVIGLPLAILTAGIVVWRKRRNL